MTKNVLFILKFIRPILVRCVLPISVCLLVVGTNTRGYAQVCGEFELREIEKMYGLGKFDEVLESVQNCLENGFADSKQEEESLVILAKSYLELNEIELARTTVTKLLNLNQNYEPSSSDPGLFKVLVSEAKMASIAQTVTAVSKKPENVREAPATVMVITENDIRERGYIDLEQLFSDLPGFDISHIYGVTYSNVFQRGYRSDNTDRILFLIDGVEDNELWIGGVYLARQYSITNVKRVEVIYGPAATMYGANAFLGVINVVTKDEQNFRKNRNVYVSADVGYGTYNTQYADITLMLRRNSISASFTARKFYSDEMDLSDYPEFDFNVADYDKYNYSSFLDVTTGANEFVRKNAETPAFREYFTFETNTSGDTIAARLTEAGASKARSSDKAQFEGEKFGRPVGYSNLTDHLLFYGKFKVADFTIGFQTWHSRNGTLNFYHDNYRLGGKHGSVWAPRQSFVYARYEKDITPKLTFQNLAQFKVMEVDDETNTIDFYGYSNGRLSATNLVNGDDAYWKQVFSSVVSKQFRNEMKLNYNPNTRLNILTGLEVRNGSFQGDYRQTEDASSSAIEVGAARGDLLPGGNNFNMVDVGFYLQGSYAFLPILKLTLGGRYDYNRIRVSGGYGSQFNPRVALVATPGKFILKGIYARAFQNASIWQKYATTSTRAGNPTLQPETASNVEVSVGYTIAQRIFADLVFYRATYNGIANLQEVEGLPDNKTQQFQAIGKLQVRGVQATVNGRWRDAFYFANYTYTDPRNQRVINGVLTDNFERVGDIAGHQFNVGVGMRFFDQLSVHLRANFIGDRPVGEGTTVPNNPGLPNSPGIFPASTILFANLAYDDILPGLGLQVICANVLNTEYFDPGVRSANVSTFAYRIPQRRRNFIVRLMYNF